VRASIGLETLSDPPDSTTAKSARGPFSRFSPLFVRLPEQFARLIAMLKMGESRGNSAKSPNLIIENGSGVEQEAESGWAVVAVGVSVSSRPTEVARDGERAF
jgi:hypothetical protein